MTYKELDELLESISNKLENHLDDALMALSIFFTYIFLWFACIGSYTENNSPIPLIIFISLHALTLVSLALYKLRIKIKHKASTNPNQPILTKQHNQTNGNLSKYTHIGNISNTQK